MMYFTFSLPEQEILRIKKNLAWRIIFLSPGEEATLRKESPRTSLVLTVVQGACYAEPFIGNEPKDIVPYLMTDGLTRSFSGIEDGVKVQAIGGDFRAIILEISPATKEEKNGENISNKYPKQ